MTIKLAKQMIFWYDEIANCVVNMRHCFGNETL